MADIDAKIKAQGDKIRELKTAKSGKDVIEPEVKILLSLKADFKVCSCFILFWLFSPMTILEYPVPISEKVTRGAPNPWRTQQPVPILGVKVTRDITRGNFAKM